LKDIRMAARVQDWLLALPVRGIVVHFFLACFDAFRCSARAPRWFGQLQNRTCLL
jgi:hypothetical protein